jgi:carbamoyl-phosphate synthase large subunit
MSSNISKCILVSSAGTATALNVVKSISRIPNLRVITADTNEKKMFATSSRWNTKHYQVPLASDGDAFISSLVDICTIEGLDAIYPIHDAEILAVATQRHRFPGNVVLPLNSSESIRNANDKLLNFHICQREGLPVPDTIVGTDLRHSDLERYGTLIRKPRSGVGSIGVRRITSFEGLLAHHDLTDAVLYQQECQGLEYTIDAIRVGAELVAVARERIEAKAGVCTKARVFVNQGLSALAWRIADVFDLHGLFCFQVIGDIAAGDVKIIDINPRCGGGTALSAAAGFPILEWHFSHVLGLIEASKFKEECLLRSRWRGEAIVCRYYEEIVTFTS